MFSDAACFATEEGRDTWTGGSNSASILEGLSEPLTQFHFRSSIRPVARKRLQRTVSEETQNRHTAYHINALFSACSEHLPVLQSASRRYNLSWAPGSVSSTPRGFFLCCSPSRGGGGGSPSRRREAVQSAAACRGGDAANQRGGERSEDAAALFNGDWLSSNGAAAWRAWVIWWHPSGQK